MTKAEHKTLSTLISDLILKVKDCDKTKSYSEKSRKHNEVAQARWKIHEFMDNLK